MDESKSGWQQYDECFDIVCRTTKGEFLEEKSGVYLLGELSEADADDLLTFRTKLHKVDLDALATGPQGTSHDAHGTDSQSSDLKPGPFLLEFVKRDGSVWLDAYSLGRARNNDVVLRHPSVSKLHARIQGAEHFQNESLAAPYSIEDMGSSVGTWVGERKVDSDVPSPLQTGDRCRFGHLECVFVDAAMLYDILLDRTFED